ncbi:uncharacterized protein LOC108915438 [Anoplophora glabripennis]|uniref:uncharacterized protein LOC108915438 n=1 Tax=Anoplophora glabripennis TaxID=217634 RepID=UPI0008750EAD|nr:uncharacterized protein LOC108915438 [Anoplophora glabripennis]XP_018576981.1 uncharacterized protein LOC108915438 [Anoplophora glabripennis]
MSNEPKGKKRPFPFADKVRKFIADFEDLQYDGAKIVCTICDSDLMCWDKYDCIKHVNSQHHRDKKQGVPSKFQLMVDLLLMLVACNVPLSILDKQPFREFWKKYAPELHLPSTRSINTYLPEVRKDVIDKIKCGVKNKQLWLCVDETTDIKKISVVNIIIRILDSLHPASPLLLASRRLTKCTARTITRVVLDTLEQFEISASQVLLFVTDGAASMRLVGRSLQEHGCRFLHITCKIHALHLVAETVRNCFPGVDTLITSTNKVFLKSPKRLRAFHDKCPDIPEPPQSILTHWGTWLKAAFYYAVYFQQIKTVILQFKPDEAAAIKESQTQFQDISVENDLQTIHNNYKGLHDAIEKLQNSALSLAESLQIVDDIGSTLHAIKDVKNDCVVEKWESVLKKNSDFIKLREIWGGASTDTLSECREYFNYACVTSVDVEHSFSQYNHIFSSKRTCLLEETVETYLMLQNIRKWCPVSLGDNTDNTSDNNKATSSRTS